MNPLLSAISRYIHRPNRNRDRIRKSHREARWQRFCLEVLEDRTLLSPTISIAGATMNEIGSPSAFITTGSGGLSSPEGITLGSDGNVYVAGNGGAVLRYNGTTGAYTNTFVSQGSGGLAFKGAFAGLAFGPDGNLYVASGATNQVLEYNGSTGAFVEAFVTAGSGGLIDPQGITFGPDGNLYVASGGSNAILRFEGPSDASPGTPLPAAGQSGATFVANVVPSSLGNGYPVGVAFGPDGNLYVNGGPIGVRRYSSTTGAFIDTFVPYQDPADGNVVGIHGNILFDQQGRLYVGDQSDTVHCFDAQGNFLGNLLIGSVNTELSRPLGMTLDAQGDLLISCYDSNSVVRYDRGVTVTLSAPTSTPVSVNYTTVDGTALAGTNYVAQSGTVTFAPGQTSQEILLTTEEDPQATGNVAFSVQLSNPTGGATIGIATATVNITVADTTRQFAVAGTSAIEGDNTAHYRGALVQGIPGTGFVDMTVGPDGTLYTTDGPGLGDHDITMYNGTTGALIGQFYAPGVYGMAVNGSYLYVGNPGNNSVDQYNATTGAFVSTFVSGVSGGPNDVAFGPDANGNANADLYVATSNGVSRYDGVTGAYLGTYIANGSGGLNGAKEITFDPSQTYLYVISGSNQILEYNARTSVYIGAVSSTAISNPADIKFGPDGLLYVLSTGNNRILRFTASGTYVDDYVPPGIGGIGNLFWMAFGPTGDLYVSSGNFTKSLLQYPQDSQIFRFGTENEAVFTVTNNTPSTVPLTVNYATADGTAHAGTNYTATSGTLTFAPGVTTQTIRVPILDSGSQTTPLTFTVNLSSPQLATLTRGQATGTIAPSDAAAKFYVVNAATPSNGGTNTTFKYQVSGTEQAPYGLSVTTANPDLAPLGLATNAAGTMQWVVDANENVYVYSPGGTLLGSWSPGGLPAGALPYGITTDGTNIWLLDASTDKVFYYAGAASRLSGSQNATSSFKLNRSDSGSNNLVSDGKSIWVVDGLKLQVFKYTVAGKLLGSWSIDPADTHPTGITINPNNVSDVWIVDNGTDKVYQYIGAASRTSGSQSAGATFALAAGNTNPQGIALDTVNPLYTYDSQGHLISSAYTYPNGNLFSRVYASDGSSTATLTDSNGTLLDTYNYNTQGQVTSLDYANGNILTYTYSNGVLSSAALTNSSGTLLDDYSYNSAGVLTAYDVYYSNGNVFHRVYASDGSSTVTLTNSSGVLLDDYSYNTQGQLTASDVYEANGNTLTSSYSNGVVSTATLKNSSGTLLQTYNYNSQRQVTSIDYASNGNVLTYTYSNGVLSSATLNASTANGGALLQTYNYNTQGHLSTIVYASNGNVMTYTYDTSGVLSSSTLANSSGTTLQTYNYTFNAQNQLSSLKDGSGNLLYSYAYDSLGRVSTVTYASNGNMLTYTYNSDGASSATLATSSSTLIAAYKYDVFSRVTEIDYANGNTYTRTYAANGTSTAVLKNKNSQTIETYTYDAQGNLIGHNP